MLPSSLLVVVPKVMVLQIPFETLIVSVWPFLTIISSVELGCPPVPLPVVIWLQFRSLVMVIVLPKETLTNKRFVMKKIMNFEKLWGKRIFMAEFMVFSFELDGSINLISLMW